MFCLLQPHIVVYRDTDIVYRVPYRAVCIAYCRTDNLALGVSLQP